LTLCREWSLVKATATEAYAKPLKCRSWSCEFCRPERKAQLCARAASGLPNRFLTLTSNPRVGNSPEERLRLLAYAWRLIVKRQRREHPDEEIEYLAIAEETKAGEPHLHILLRSPFIAQAVISAAMKELADAPIVDIRKVRNVHEAVSYVAKYIAKAPKQFGNAKRYWSSQNYEIEDGDYEPLLPLPDQRWQVVRGSLESVVLQWIYEGKLSRQWRGETIVGFQPGRGPPL